MVQFLGSTIHPIGRSKAKFFLAHGFSVEKSRQLAAGLKKIAHTGKIQERMPSPYGLKLVIDGILDTPTGRQVKLRTVWIRKGHPGKMHFVTAYPG